MKRKDIRALHLKSHTELNRELASKQQELAKFRLETRVKREKNSRRLKNLRRDIAIMATILKQLQSKPEEGK